MTAYKMLKKIISVLMCLGYGYSVVHQLIRLVNVQKVCKILSLLCRGVCNYKWFNVLQIYKMFF